MLTSWWAADAPGSSSRVLPGGCATSNVPGDLLVRAGRQLDTLRPCRAIVAVWVLSKLEYLAVCRSFQLLTLHARGDAAKAFEILVLLPRSPLVVLVR